MTFQVLAQADRSRVLLLPQSGSKTLFEGYLRLKDMPQGPRAFKFLVKKDDQAEKFLPPEDALRMLRKADAIYLARGDPVQEKKFIDLLQAYQLGYRFVQVCNHCLGQRKVTYVEADAITYKGRRICENCAAAELLREADFRGLGRAAKAHLARILKTRRNLDDVVGLLSLQRLEPELTRFDIIPASHAEPTLPLASIALPPPLMQMMQRRLTKLLPVQSRSVKAGLLEGRNQLVVSATATGKSLVGELAGVKNLLEGRGKLLFLVPLVALANQKFDQLSAYRELGFRTSIRVGVSRIRLGKGRKVPQSLDADIIAGTYEGIDQVIRTKKSLGRVGTVVIDEVHMLEDAERGHRLAGMIARLKNAAPKAQFIFLSATVGNPAALAKRLGATLVEYEVRPVPIERHLIFSSGPEKRKLLRQLSKEAQALTSSTGYKGQSIIFTNSRKNCYNLADSIPGAAAYHAGLQYPERKRIEELFGDGKIHTVVTTAALAAGVDFPASQVVFESLAMGIEWLNVHEFNQMLGRAGRPGYHDKGLVYILAEPGRRFSSGKGESEDEMALALLHGQMEDVAPEFEDAQQQEEVLANVVAARSRAELERLHDLTVGLDDLNSSLASLEKAGLVRGIVATRLGEAAAAHFLAPEQVATIVRLLGRGKSPQDVAVQLESFEALYLKFAERISTKLHMQISQRALHGSFLDLLSSADLRELDNKLQRYCMDFSRDFLRCTCKESPYCGCVQKSISLRILELREDGKSPEEIIDHFSDRYGMYAYQGDLINWLDQMVRYLEAIEAVARVLGKEAAAKEAAERKARVEGE
ncbi:MAG: putative ATP-dependent helicase [Euryarchaeota archaeon]|nr:putative ATP-dependent helicase [Euryarchaeota archaeon]